MKTMTKTWPLACLFIATSCGGGKADRTQKTEKTDVPANHSPVSITMDTTMVMYDEEKSSGYKKYNP